MTKTTTTTMCTRTDRIMAALAIGLTGGAAWAMTSLASTPSTQPRVHLAAASTVIAAAEPCKPGYVWRDKFDGDALCVTPAERDAAHAKNDAAPADKSQHRVDHHRGSGVVPRGERDRTSPDEE